MIEDSNLYGETFFVPKRARWRPGTHEVPDEKITYIVNLKEDVGNQLNKALAALEDSSPELTGVLKHIDFKAPKGKTSFSDRQLLDLIHHFDKYHLTNEDFEFPDLLGAAYEFLIKDFADSAGKKGGEFYTPNRVVSLLVNIIEPQEGMTVYDPTVGSGGMLIQSKQYIEEQGQNGRNLALYGQDNNGTVWSICKMNMILHNIPDAHIERVTEKIEPGDTNFISPLIIKIFYATAGWQSDPPDFSWAFMLLPYSEIEDNLPGLLKIWVEKTETLKPVYNLYFAGIYRSTYPENEFLNLTQAIETYHRRIYGGEYISENVYLNGLYKILTDAIPHDISVDFWSSLQKGKLRYAHEYSLWKRIFLLSQHVSENLPATFLNGGKAQSDYAERIANTRNYLTHYSPELKEKAIIGGKELFEVNNQLGMIINFCFLEQLGIPYNKIEALLYKDRRYQKYISKSKDSSK